MLEQRRMNYANQLDNQSMSLLFSGFAPVRTADEFYPFEVNRNFFYLTGIDQENVCLMTLKGQGKIEHYLFIEKIDPIKALWDGAGLTFEEASKIALVPVDHVMNIEVLDTFIAQMLSTTRRALFGAIDTIYLDLERLNEKVPPTFAINFAQKLSHLYPYLNIRTSQMLLAEMRSSKDNSEIEDIQKAIHITKVGLERVMKHLQVGRYEFQVEAEYNYVLNLHRSSPSFGTIAAMGKNATVLHYRDNASAIEPDSLVLFDLGCFYNHYCSDITRTFPATGTFTKRQREVYEVVLDVNKQAIDFVKPGMTLKEYNEFGKKLLTEGAKKLGLIKEDHEIDKYYYHSLGHYLGLDVHDVGNYAKPIPEGAILTVEPGLYIAEEGIGIRIEDDIVVRKSGNINLSKDIIKEVKDIEDYMKKNRK
ncbi:MAG: aminopeptidase P family protein [Acholeplasmataceae bacterium]|jgi:Xaa-Pro aminopeptidase